MEEMSEGISDEFDVDFAMTLSKVIPLDSHSETTNSFAYSMYINYGSSIEGEEEDYIISATATFVNAAGKILFLYCYAPQDELKWTQKASRAWAETVKRSNAQPPSGSSGVNRINWGEVLKKGIVGALAGGLFALLYGLFSRFKKEN